MELTPDEIFTRRESKKPTVNFLFLGDADKSK
jgi:hypothetical protein